MSSRHIQLRLNDDNGNEAAALAILDQYLAGGHTTRQVITLALLSLARQQANVQDVIHEVQNMRHDLIETMRHELSRLQAGAVITSHQQEQLETALSDELLSAVKRNAKRGASLE